MDMVWPTFFVVGAQKCGTSSLYKQMMRHPQIFVPATKEPEFFTSSLVSGRVMHTTKRLTSLEAYQQEYRSGASARAIGEFSTGYLWDKSAPERIYEVNPQARVIIILRDPVIRAHSAYLMFHRNGRESASTFNEALSRDAKRDKSFWHSAFHYVDAGLYHPQIKRYFDIFGRNQVQVLMFEDLIKRPRELFFQIAHHIGIDPEPFESMELTEAYNVFREPRSVAAYQLRHNRYLTKIRRTLLPTSVQKWLRNNSLLYSHEKPLLDEASRMSLQEAYASDISRLEDLLGRQLPELRKSWQLTAEAKASE